MVDRFTIRACLLEVLRQVQPAFLEIEEFKSLSIMVRAFDTDAFMEKLQREFPDSPLQQMHLVQQRLKQELFVAYAMESIFLIQTGDYKGASRVLSEAESISRQDKRFLFLDEARAEALAEIRTWLEEIKKKPA